MKGNQADVASVSNEMLDCYWSNVKVFTSKPYGDFCICCFEKLCDISVAAVKTEIIEELEKHRDAELAEQREKRHKAEAEKERKHAEQSANSDEAKVSSSLHCVWIKGHISFLA